jgi:hypothetical protein
MTSVWAVPWRWQVDPAVAIRRAAARFVACHPVDHRLPGRRGAGRNAAGRILSQQRHV